MALARGCGSPLSCRRPLKGVALVDDIRPCGPVIDAVAADRALTGLAMSARDGGWTALLEKAQPALAPVFAASPYLTGLCIRDPDRLRMVLQGDPDVVMSGFLRQAQASGELDFEAGRKALRQAKAGSHLMIALADLGAVWDLNQVTAALTQLADVSVEAAMSLAAGQQIVLGRLIASPPTDHGPLPGFFCLALGKQGAHELNYSSDIDIVCFYEPASLLLADGVEPHSFCNQFIRTVATILSERTADGYVFRVDLRLRPDPSSTQPALPLDAAFEYYESVGQNWERAAFIKARPCAGDRPLAASFLSELQPFIWRRNLDFTAIADIQSIKRQIHTYKVDDRLTAKGADLKLGRGGIREVEFYTQTQQLILGGRHKAFRSRRTLDALAALADVGQISAAANNEMADAYVQLRRWEHRAQMVADEQTHTLPEAETDRRRIAALSGEGDLRRFDAQVTRTLQLVNKRYGELFPEAEPLSSRFGSLVFTGVDNDPETLATLKRMGFSNPPQVSQTIRSWHHGRIGATRTERGRELFTSLAPRLLEAARATGAADTAFIRFSDFFTGLKSGVQVQSLFLAQPGLFKLVVEVLAFAPQLASTLARRPAALDALLDPSFFQPVDMTQDRASFELALAQAEGFEGTMNAARLFHNEQAFRIGVQVISGIASPTDAGHAFADLADLCIDSMSRAALAETGRQGGEFPGEVAVVALGKCGSREMTAGSDLDLMTLYRPASGAMTSSIKGWGAETFYARFTQRLIAGLSALTAAGRLYDVDMRLRPSGTAGPVAVSFGAFQNYYLAGEAETWEFLALTRARVVWSTSADFAAEASRLIEEALRQPGGSKAQIAADVLDMRQLMEAALPAKGFWDMKHSPGGLIDIEFVAQYLQLSVAGSGGPLATPTVEALRQLGKAGVLSPTQVDDLEAAWSLQQSMSQLLRVALSESADPQAEPRAFKALLARSAHVANLSALKRKIAAQRQNARRAYVDLVPA